MVLALIKNADVAIEGRPCSKLRKWAAGFFALAMVSARARASEIVSCSRKTGRERGVFCESPHDQRISATGMVCGLRHTVLPCLEEINLSPEAKALFHSKSRGNQGSTNKLNHENYY
jgi:hypothetical protein